MEKGTVRGRGVLRTLRRITGFFQRAMKAYNRRMGKVYSPRTAALTGTAIVLVMILIVLFLPPFAGIADDGSLSTVMSGVGLGIRGEDLSYPVGAYATRVYLHSTRLEEGISSHQALIRLAMWLDDRVTGDNLFDIRFLAGVYTALYLPAVYLVLHGMMSRVKAAAEATFLMAIGVLVMGDAALTVNFNSLYPDAVWIIGITWCLGLAMTLQRVKPGMNQASLVGFTIAGCVLTLSESPCAAAGIVLAVFLARMMLMEERTMQTSVTAGVCAAVMLTAAMLSATAGADRMTEASKLHAMTNGVLLRADDPEEALAEFGIDARFETLSDESSYDLYPYALSGNPEIQRDFLSRYSTETVALYHIRHPLDYIGLLELATKAAFHPARSYVGNFENSAGLPERSVNGQLVFYSNFKANSLPQTLGFLVILGGVYWGLFRKRRGLSHFQTRWTFRERQIMLDSFLMLAVVGIAHMSGILFLSGTAELERYQMLCGVCIDGMLLLFVAEILHRLNILSTEG